MIGVVGRAVYWLIWPAIWLYLPFTTRTRLLVSLPDGRTLFIKNHINDGRWGLPGGGVHRGETTEAGAIRELREETGIIVPPEQLEKVYQGPDISHGLRYKSVFYRVRLSDEPVLKLQKAEVSQAAWLPPQSVSGLSRQARRLLQPPAG